MSLLNDSSENLGAQGCGLLVATSFSWFPGDTSAHGKLLRKTRFLS
jgi:hypothetical protein